IQRLAFVGHTLGGSVQDPGACGELQRARCLNAINPKLSDDQKTPLKLDCERAVLTDPDSRDNTADVEAYVILEGPIDVAPIADGDPYIEAARTEVQPRISDIDGFVGASILNRLEQLRIDYQGVSADDVDSGTRFITRCKAADGTCMLAAKHP